jgi:hypothetical protein
MLNRTLISAVAVAALAFPAAGHAKGRTETIRVYSKMQQFTITAPDGTVAHRPPAGPPAAGSVMEIESLDYRGTFNKHEKRPSFSDYLRCTFGTDPENPECFGYVAIDGSLLRFHGFDVVGGTGRYLGATGKTVSSKEVEGGSELVAKVKLAR